MRTKKAFRRNEHWSEDGVKLSHLAGVVSTQFLKEAVRAGYKLRDAQLMLMSSVNLAAAQLLVRKTAPRDLKKLTKERRRNR